MSLPGLRILWLRWVAVNAFGEMIGLGLTFVVIASVFISFGDQAGVITILFTFLATVASGAIEATLVGLGQWWAMNPWFPGITRRAWWLATLAGALLAYVLGYLPSTLMGMGEQASQSQTQTTEPAQWIVLILAAGLGAVAGAVLSFAQWLTMRKKIARAYMWIPANMLAWLVGMPIIFWSIDVAQKLRGLLGVILFMACVLFLVGLLVGAIHGSFLVRLAGQEKLPN